MIIDAHATDTVPSHEVRQRALEALTNAGEPMSEVTYDALRKRLAAAEAENRKLRGALMAIKSHTQDAHPMTYMDQLCSIARTALGEKDDGKV